VLQGKYRQRASALFVVKGCCVMGLSYASNINSLRVQTQARRTTQDISQRYERLSSGFRINSASDDPSGLIMAEQLRRDTNIATVAIRNANDGLSLTAIADSGLSEISNMLQRMAELSEQSANGTYTSSQRSALSLEFTALGSEIERISRTTQFNSVNLLSGSSSTTLQVGFDSSANSRITINAVSSTLASLGLASSGSSALSFSIIGTTSAASELAAQFALDAVNAAINTINVTRGILGAVENRLSYAINHLTVTRENYIAAESRIRDADVATELAELIRLQVLQQSQVALIAQANQEPARVAELLQ
jgi:flagellin